MGRLVINELYKIFKKKSIYVLGIITFLFMVLSMFLYKDMSSSDLISSEFNRSVIFVMICIIMVSSTIVSDEYNGTIKQLLIKPYKRYEILLSK
jgi:ABC-2 type transport system permease protein